MHPVYGLEAMTVRQIEVQKNDLVGPVPFETVQRLLDGTGMVHHEGARPGVGEHLLQQPGICEVVFDEQNSRGPSVHGRPLPLAPSPRHGTHAT